MVFCAATRSYTEVYWLLSGASATPARTGFKSTYAEQAKIAVSSANFWHLNRPSQNRPVHLSSCWSLGSDPVFCLQPVVRWGQTPVRPCFRSLLANLANLAVPPTCQAPKAPVLVGAPRCDPIQLSSGCNGSSGSKKKSPKPMGRVSPPTAFCLRFAAADRSRASSPKQAWSDSRQA